MRIGFVFNKYAALEAENVDIKIRNGDIMNRGNGGLGNWERRLETERLTGLHSELVNNISLFFKGNVDVG